MGRMGGGNGKSEVRVSDTGGRVRRYICFLVGDSQTEEKLEPVTHPPRKQKSI